MQGKMGRDGRGWDNESAASTPDAGSCAVRCFKRPDLNFSGPEQCRRGHRITGSGATKEGRRELMSGRSEMCVG